MAAKGEALTNRFGTPGRLGLVVASLAFVGAGLAGQLSAAWGYALFMTSAVLLAAGSFVFAVFVMSKAGDGAALQRAFTRLLLWGAWAYVLALAALAGYYAYETLQGRMEWHWIVFGPVVLASLVILDMGLYRKLVQNNLPTWRRFRVYIKRDDVDPAAMRRTLVDEVLVHRTLFAVSKLRWLRHSLIFWGFAGMVLVELFAVLVREGFPAFGWRDVWREAGNPVRLGFDFLFDLTGLMMLAGCVLALIWRAMANSTPERKYADTPTTLFLLLVVASGFVLEGWRIAPALHDSAHGASFVGVVFAQAVNGMGLAESDLYKPLWILHVIGSCVFIAYVPLRRMIHTCATPLGRLMNSQQRLLAAKKRGVIGAMLLGRGTVDGNYETLQRK